MIIKNRFGRIVDVPEEQGKSMIKEDGATLYEPEAVKTETANQDNQDKNPLECTYCGKICKNQLGFTKHTEACKKKATSSL